MPDVFVSYSRKNKEFVQKFADQLIADGRDIWIDWEDIPVTADWLEEIYQGIRESNAFIFIISPDSVNSEVCGWELKYAIENQKRFIPILHREIVEPADKEKMHTAISSHNWLFFRDQDDFDASFAILRQALDTDLQHVREHTRLLIRGREWDNKNRSNSYLLQGDDLAQAESWLAEAQTKKPHPTQLHSEYIYASRKAANRRQQILLSTALVVTVISSILAILAVIGFISAEQNRQDAVEQRELAERNAEVSERLAIAANAQLEFSLSNNDLAIALARHAVDIQNPPVEASRILEDTVFAPGTRYVLRGHTDNINAIDLSPDDRLVASGGNDGLVIVWNVETGAEEHRFEFGEGDHRIRAVAFSPDGTMLAAADRDGEAIIIWNTADYSEIQRIDELGDWVNRLEFSPDNTKVVAGFSDDTSAVVIYDVESGEGTVLGNDEVRHSDTIEGVGFSPDGSMVASGSSDGQLIIWNVETGEPVNVIDTGTEVTGVDFSPDGRSVLTGGGADSNFALRIWDIETGDLAEPPLSGHLELPNDAEFDASGRFIFSGSSDTTVRFWNLQIRRELVELSGHTDSVRDVALSRSGLIAVSASNDRTVRIWDLAHGSQIAQFNGHLATNVIGTIGFTPDGSRIFSGGWDANAIVWDIATGEETFRFSDHDTWVLDGEVDESGARLIVAEEGGAVVYDLETGGEIIRFTEHGERVRRVAISPDGTVALTGGTDNRIMLWNVDTGELLVDPIDVDDTLDSVEISTDGTRFIFTTFSNAVSIRTIDNPTEDLYLFEDTADFAHFTADDSRILVVNGNRATIIDVESGQELVVFEGHNSEIFSTDFNSDETQMVTGSSDGTIRLWDMATGTELRRISVGTAIYAVAFSPDDSTVVSSDFAVRLWEIEPPSVEDVLLWADDHRYDRDLTTEECIQFRIQSCIPPEETESAGSGDIEDAG